MDPLDPRHGTRAGYIAGCSNDCCREPHIRYQKLSNLRRHREGSQRIPVTPLLERIQWWADRGVTLNALCHGANLGEGTLHEMVAARRHLCNKTTAAALLAVTWDRLPDNALVNAHITKARVYSLMAAGHPLGWIVHTTPHLAMGGKWRNQDKVKLGLARAVLATYETAAPVGPSRQTASKALAKGALLPAAWDDPGEPAMPLTWEPTEAIPAERLRRGRPELNSAYIEDLEWMADTDQSLTEAANRLGLKRDTIHTICLRTNRLDLYRRLASREPNADHYRATTKGLADKRGAA